MRRRDLILGVGAAAALAACQRQQQKADTPAAGEAGGDAAGAGGRAMTDPAMVVRQLYDPYLTPNATFPALRDQAPWSAGLWAQLEAMVARSQARNEPILDFDPVIGAQDHQLGNLNVTTEAISENSHAVVRASFTNLGRGEEIVYDLIWEGDRWKVDNIRGRDWDLRQISQQDEAAPASP
jgi:hypothetical protein